MLPSQQKVRDLWLFGQRFGFMQLKQLKQSTPESVFELEMGRFIGHAFSHFSQFTQLATSRFILVVPTTRQKIL